MKKKIDKIHEELFDDLDEMNKWIEDSDDDIIVINVQKNHVSTYTLFYGIKDKEV